MKCVWRHWSAFDKNIISGNTVLNQDFKEFIQSLNDNRCVVLDPYDPDNCDEDLKDLCTAKAKEANVSTTPSTKARK